MLKYNHLNLFRILKNGYVTCSNLLVKAESAYLNLECQPPQKKIAHIVEHEIHPAYHSGRTISERDLISGG